MVVDWARTTNIRWRGGEGLFGGEVPMLKNVFFLCKANKNVLGLAMLNH